MQDNTIYTGKAPQMKHRGQLIRIREAVAKKITAVQLLQSIQQTRILTKSQALDIVLDHFLSNRAKDNKE